MEKEQFLPLSTIFCYLMLDCYVKTGIRFSVRDKRLFEITEAEITRVDCISSQLSARLAETGAPEEKLPDLPYKLNLAFNKD